MKRVSMETLRRDLQTKLKLRLLAGEQGLAKRRVSIAEINRPGMALTGFFDYFPSNRVQVMGLTEFTYLKGISKAEREKVLQRLLGFSMPALIVTRSQRLYPQIVAMADEQGIPLFSSPLHTTRIISEVHEYLEDMLAPENSVYGTLLDVYGVGVLILGESGVGKSECALDLIKEGHRLVGDDVIVARKIKGGLLMGYPSPIIGHHMELRGLGVVDIEKIYGYRAVREGKHMELVISLEPWDEKKQYERLGLERAYHKILGVSLPHVTLPLRSGRNLTVIIEVAATDYRLSRLGINSASDFNRKILRYMNKER
jgi:HPr kinase/phosphorylase